MTEVLAELLKSITETIKWVIPSVWGVGMALTVNRTLRFKEDGRLIIFTSMAGVFAGYFGFNYNFNISPDNMEISKRFFAGVGGLLGGTLIAFIYANSSTIYKSILNSILKTVFDYLKDKFKPKDQ